MKFLVLDKSREHFSPLIFIELLWRGSILTLTLFAFFIFQEIQLEGSLIPTIIDNKMMMLVMMFLRNGTRDDHHITCNRAQVFMMRVSMRIIDNDVMMLFLHSSMLM
jgi:hypothetical protein